MFDPKIVYEFTSWDEYTDTNKETIIELQKQYTWQLVKETIPDKYLESIEEKIEITDEHIGFICTYKPLMKR